MTNNKNISDNNNTCIQQDKLIAYLKGKLTDKEMNLVEKHLAICPMCSDELEGLSKLDNPKEIEDIGGSINKKIDEITQIKKRKTIAFPYPLRVAASILFIIGISAILYYTIDITGTSIEISEHIPAKEEAPTATEKDISHSDTYDTPPEKPVIPKEKAAEIVEYREEKIVEPVDDIDTDMLVAESPPPMALIIVKEDITIDADKEIIIADDYIADTDFIIDTESEKEQVAQFHTFDAEKETSGEILIRGYAKSTKEAEEFDKLVMSEEKEQQQTFIIVEKMPEFINDDYDNFADYIAKNLKYPAVAKKDRIEGTVFVSFEIGTDGKVSNTKIIRGVHPELDNEALRVISSSPKWQPGKQRDESVKVTMTFPISFVID